VKGLSREEAAARVCQALADDGIPVVLSGGAAVSIWSENQYESFDLDFIQTGLARRVDATMQRLGFRRQGRHWTHADSPFWVEFPPGPVQVGEAIVSEFASRRTATGVLHLLAPSECVMDRLSGYYHWSDLQCLDQAVAVSRRHEVDLGRIEAWSRREGAGRKFEVFRERLERARAARE